MKFKSIIMLAIGLFTAIGLYAQGSPTVEDYLNLPGPVLFENVSYNLVFSDHPTENYYKQEYLAADDNLKRFKRLITIDVLVGSHEVMDLVNAKAAELAKLKKSNPIVNYQILTKDDEVILDFLLSQNTPDGKDVEIIERNVYRYNKVTDKNGHQAVLLFGISERAYKNGIDKFFDNLMKNKNDLIGAVGRFEMPEILVLDKI